MGMDVYGQTAIEECGKYFRANVWSWVVIKKMIDIVNRKNRIIDQYNLEGMNSNSGCGLDAEKSIALAQNLEEFLKEDIYNEPGFEIEGEEIHEKFVPDDIRAMGIGKSGGFLSESEIKIRSQKGEKIYSAYSTNFDHVREFIDFLRACGGFEVW